MSREEILARINAALEEDCETVYGAAGTSHIEVKVDGVIISIWRRTEDRFIASARTILQGNIVFSDEEVPEAAKIWARMRQKMETLFLDNFK